MDLVFAVRHSLSAPIWLKPSTRGLPAPSAAGLSPPEQAVSSTTRPSASFCLMTPAMTPSNALTLMPPRPTHHEIGIHIQQARDCYGAILRQIYVDSDRGGKHMSAPTPWFIRARLKTRQLMLLTAICDEGNIHRA